MATGIGKREKVGADALVAESIHSEPFPLPESPIKLTFDYPNKLSEQVILREAHHEFCTIDRAGYTAELRKAPINSLLLADNYYGLKKLQEHYAGKVRLIYLDPPYGTGLDFQSRALQHAYRDVLGAAAWLEFLRRRLILMRELLAENGSMYVHIGHQMLFPLKIVMDEIFGENNFHNLIVRKKCSSKNYTKNQYPNLNDYILFYSKSGKYVWNQPSLVASKDWIDKEYPKIDGRGRYKLVPIHAPGVRHGETGKPWKGMQPPPGKHWQFTPSKLDELDKAGEMHWSRNGNPRRKVYLPPNKGITITDYWDTFRDAHHQSILITGYPTEKNFEMLKMIVEASSNPGDIVLDPFCGSGTSLHAANDLRRKWIGIDQSFSAAEATIRRIRQGMSPMGDYVNGNGASTVDLFENAGVSTINKAAPSKLLNFVVDKAVYEKHKSELIILASI